MIELVWVMAGYVYFAAAAHFATKRFDWPNVDEPSVVGKDFSDAYY